MVYVCRVFSTGGGMYKSAWWSATVQVWEVVAYAFIGPIAPLLWIGAILAAVLLWQRSRRTGFRKKKRMFSGSGGSKGVERDLDV
jgi:hypothetical protein